MKKTVYIILSISVASLFASCEKEMNQEADIQGPVYVTAQIDQSTKSTVSDAGAFAFSSLDEIAICNDGTTIYTGATTSTTNTADFAMTGGFNGGNNGIAGFPASLVSAMTTSSVTFTLPTSYTYAEVGASTENAGKVPNPMLGTYTSGEAITLKHAGALVRFRLTNLKAGSVSFTFPTNVTGTVTLTSVPSGTGEGILAANLTGGSKTITVTGVPAVAGASYIYVTLPVPTGTAPQDILVTNEPSDASASQMVALAGSATGLERAGGYKLAAIPVEISTPVFSTGPSSQISFAPGNLMAKIGAFVSPKVTAVTEWKFGGYLEKVGVGAESGNSLLYHNSGSCVGKWVDLFTFQGASVAAANRAHGLVYFTNNQTDTYNGNVASESVYDGCWNTNADNTEEAGYIQISNGGSYQWRPLTKDEMEYIMLTRTTSALGGQTNARFARATVAGVNGLLVFPDDIELKWNTTTMGAVPSDVNGTGTYTWGTDIYSSTQFINMYSAGVIFFPRAGYGYNSKSEGVKLYDNISGVTGGGRYWTGSSADDGKGYRFRFSDDQINISTIERWYYFSVRLVRTVAP